MPDIVLIMRNDLDLLVGRAICPHQPERRGVSTWWYPWAHMEPGHFFTLMDPSLEARRRLAAAATMAAKKTGHRYATGRADGIGWWCARVDGCEILPFRPLTQEEQHQRTSEEMAAFMRKLEKRKGKRVRRLEPRPAPSAELGTFAPELRPQLEEADYSDWAKPRDPGEAF
jgi:hypothetical protein